MLRYRRDIRSLVFISLALIMLIAPHLRSSPLPEASFAAQVGWITCSSLLCFVASIINHNHMHCRMFRLEALNAMANLALSVARGHTATGIVVPHHLNHHVEAGSERDWIRPALAGRRIGWLRLPRYVLRASLTMAVERMRPDAPVLLERRRRSWLIEKIFLFTVIGIALLHNWHIFLLFNVVPWLLGLSLLVGVNLLQHEGCSPQTMLGESRNFTGFIGNWLLFNNGYHTAHHRRPAAHWSELPALHSSLRDKLPEAALERVSILVYLWQFGWSRVPAVPAP